MNEHYNTRQTASQSHKPALGAVGEAIAAELLSAQGLHILDRNWRDGRRGELDIIAADPAAGCYVVVEVRTRIGSSHGSAFASIDGRKYSRLRRLAVTWLSTQEHKRHVRIDVIALTFPEGVRDLFAAGLQAQDLLASQASIHWEKAVAA
ncbi:YraN family protein [Schaalia sp. Marseille-Q2122]|uniref:YraN family protein n=1 Tax=Schaalia sp. Marseille-Q2122 TaxID=2736604 RepID=UPI00158ABCF1|nr:YraN family protein [Schaalia sp. Marseille-Q2122]